MNSCAMVYEPSLYFSSQTAYFFFFFIAMLYKNHGSSATHKRNDYKILGEMLHKDAWVHIGKGDAASFFFGTERDKKLLQTTCRPNAHRYRLWHFYSCLDFPLTTETMAGTAHDHGIWYSELHKYSLFGHL